MLSKITRLSVVITIAAAFNRPLKYCSAFGTYPKIAACSDEHYPKDIVTNNDVSYCNASVAKAIDDTLMTEPGKTLLRSLWGVQ